MTTPTIIMVAPNGARKTQKDHPALPVSIAETVDEAVLCHAAGATALHAHVRGKQDEHLLDSGLYQELIAELKRQVPDQGELHALGAERHQTADSGETAPGYAAARPLRIDVEHGCVFRRAPRHTVIDHTVPSVRR